MWLRPRARRAILSMDWRSDSRCWWGRFPSGNISGGAFNPAVATGISILGLSSWANIWIYLLAEFGGAAVAAGAFKALNPAEREEVRRLSSRDQPRQQREREQREVA